MQKPSGMFGRDHEWADLSRFVSYEGREPILGIVSGRRRQGKTFLLDAICEATGGFYFCATEAVEAESLRQFGAALARYTKQDEPFVFPKWSEAIEAMMSAVVKANNYQPTPIVIDEFAFLVNASPELPSLIQRALGPHARRGAGTPVRLLLCGSELSFMDNLLSGTAPLRGRASLDLVVPTLDFRMAADFWTIADPRLAAKVHAVVGGTPAYAREFTLGDTPENDEDFGPWVIRNVLDPSSPLFREPRTLLTDEPALREPALYHGILSAIAQGNHTRGGIAGFLGLSTSDLGHALTVLTDCGLVEHAPDAFHAKRSTYRITEPILSFYHAVVRPQWTNLECLGHAAEAWQQSSHAFLTHVMGPHFKSLCRTWTQWYARPETLGGQRIRVQSGVLSDPLEKRTHEIDVVVFARGEQQRENILAIGEAKWNEKIGVSHLSRLQHLRDVLHARNGETDDDIRLLLFSGKGFTEEIRDIAQTTDEVQLIDLERLYHGD